MPQNIAPDSSHIDQWMWVLVSAKHQIGGSQDHLVCLHMLTILRDQSHISRIIFTVGTKMQKLWRKKSDGCIFYSSWVRMVLCNMMTQGLIQCIHYSHIALLLLSQHDLFCVAPGIFSVWKSFHTFQLNVTGAPTTLTISVPQMRLCFWSVSLLV